MLPQHIIGNLSVDADALVADALRRGAPGFSRGPSAEPEMVAAVLVGALPKIAKAWQKRLTHHGYSLKIGGVFCHGAPIVKFKRGTLETKCELADLLVVSDLKVGKGIRRRASLIQAKMAKVAQHVSFTGQSSAKQMYLYQQWPAFTFVDKEYGPEVFDLRCRGVDQPGTIGVIDRHFKARKSFPPIWTQHAATPTPNSVTTEPRLGTFLAEMAGGNRHGFGRLISPNEDFAALVDLLMTVTYSKVFSLKNVLGSRRLPRGMSFLLQAGLAAGDGGGFLPPEGPEVTSIDGVGVSLLHVSISRSSER